MILTLPNAKPASSAQPALPVHQIVISTPTHVPLELTPAEPTRSVMHVNQEDTVIKLEEVKLLAKTIALPDLT